MIVLGINSAYHESAAAVVRAGAVVAAVEEERFSRQKHGKAALVSNPDRLPERAIAWALGAAGARPEDVDAVAFGFAPRARLRNVGVDPAPLGDPAGFGSEAGERAFEAGLARLPGRLRALGIAAPLRFVPHHRAHAASAFYPSPFERAAVLVLDGIGEWATSWLGRGGKAAEPGGEGPAATRRLSPLARDAYPHSIGLLWERVALHLGFSEYDAAKVMGLAALGDPGRFAAALERVFRIDPEGRPRVDLALARFRARDTASLAPLFGPPRRPDEPPDAPRFADLAAALQRATEAAILACARRLARLAPERALCYAGGVALNCVANARLEREGPFEQIYIPPAPHDAGTAIGAALEVARRLGAPPRGAAAGAPLSPFLGPAFSADEVRAAALRAGLHPEADPDAPAHAAEALAQGAIVGWFQGALEWGPRALGHRSLLADPRRPASREELNRRIKHREPFRPFGASVLEEEAAAWFELPATRDPPARELMLFAYPVRPERRAAIPAVVHRDGTCRIQTVSMRRDPRFHALIRAFAARTGVPLVLNTSFNDSEPIVCSPEEALRTAAAARIDVLYLGDLRVCLAGADPR